MLLGAVIAWGLNPLMMKIGFRELDPYAFNTLRLVTGLIMALPLVLRRGNWRPIAGTDLLTLFAIPTIGFMVFQFFYTVGVNLSSASVAAVLLGILPIVVAVLSSLLKIEKLTPLKRIGIGATFAGVVLIALGSPAGISLKNTRLLGVILLIICEIAYGTYTVFLKPLTRRYPVPQITLIMIIGALVPFGIFFLYRHDIALLATIAPQTWMAALFSGAFALVAANMLWTMGIKRLGSLNTSVYGNLQPVVGIIAAAVILGEFLTLVQSLGAIAVLFGIYVVNRRQRGQVRER